MQLNAENQEIMQQSVLNRPLNYDTTSA